MSTETSFCIFICCVCCRKRHLSSRADTKARLHGPNIALNFWKPPVLKKDVLPQQGGEMPAEIKQTLSTSSPSQFPSHSLQEGGKVVSTEASSAVSGRKHLTRSEMFGHFNIPPDDEQQKPFRYIQRLVVLERSCRDAFRHEQQPQPRLWLNFSLWISSVTHQLMGR